MSPNTPSQHPAQTINSSRSTTNHIFSIAEWLMAEAQSLSEEDAPAADINLLTKGRPGAVPGKDGGVDLTIQAKHGARTFDPAIAAFLMLTIWFTGSIAFNTVRGRGDGKNFSWPILITYAGKEPGTTKSIKLHIHIDRITMDAKPGKVVRAVPGGDYRDRRAASLQLSDTVPDEGRGENSLGRGEAIEGVLAGYKHHNGKRKGKKPDIDIDSFEALLRFALMLHDKRRAMNAA